MASAEQTPMRTSNPFSAASRRISQGISLFLANPRRFLSRDKRSASCVALPPAVMLNDSEVENSVDDHKMSEEATKAEIRRKASTSSALSIRRKKRQSAPSFKRTSRMTSSVISIPAVDPLAPPSSPSSFISRSSGSSSTNYHPDTIQLETVVTITTIEVQVAEDGDDVDIINQVVSELPEEEEDELFDEQHEGENPSLEL